MMNMDMNKLFRQHLEKLEILFYQKGLLKLLSRDVKI